MEGAAEIHSAVSVEPVFQLFSPCLPSCLFDRKISSYPLRAFEIKGKIKYCDYKEIESIGCGTTLLSQSSQPEKDKEAAIPVHAGDQLIFFFFTLLRSQRQKKELKLSTSGLSYEEVS